MRRQWSTLVVLAGSLVFLASLYLPWQQATCDTTPADGSGGILGLLNPPCRSIDGLNSEVGHAAALVTLLLVAVATAALLRRGLENRLPLGTCALTVAYFAIAVARETESLARQRPAESLPFHAHLGTFLGLGAAALTLFAATAPRARELVWDRSPPSLARLSAVACLLGTFLLPWQSLSHTGEPTITFLGIERPAGILAAVCAVFLLAACWETGTRAFARPSLLALLTALLTGAALTANTYPSGRTTAAWAALCIALALFVLGVVGVRVSHALRRPSLPGRAAWFAAAIFAVGLFLPWQQECGSDIRAAFSRQCISFNGWTSSEATTAAVLALTLAVVFASSKLSAWPIEFAVGFGLLVATAGFQLQEYRALGGYRVEFGNGATVSFVGAALLIVVALAGVGPQLPDWMPAPERIAPVAGCVAYLVMLVLPLWNVLPGRVQTGLQFAPLSWLTIAGTIVGIHLLFTWLGPIESSSETTHLLVVLPLFLLALAALDLIDRRAVGITWGGGIVVGLCVLLAVLGNVERHGGLRNLRIPEILRVDRI